MHEFINSDYAVFVGVFGLAFIFPQVLHFVFTRVPEFFDFLPGPLWFLFLVTYAAVSFVVVVIGVLGGIMSGVVIMFGFMQILFEVIG